MKFICLIVKASLLIAYLHANISYLSVRNKLNKSKSVLSSSNLTSKILHTRTCVSTCMYRDANCSIQVKKKIEHFYSHVERNGWDTIFQQASSCILNCL